MSYINWYTHVFFFFFQAEDGIRDYKVTGVQTCALPIFMGHVQSGKTANYCGLICKAADAGYKVIIVLSGVHNSLRSQTQIRMDEGFLGFMSETPGVGQNTFKRVGVGLIDSSIVANTGTNR